MNTKNLTTLVSFSLLGLMLTGCATPGDTAKQFEVQAICSILRIPNDITPAQAIAAIEQSNKYVQPTR
jgi:hypothetical protein